MKPAALLTPVGFVSHGAPMVALDPVASQPWTDWAKAFGKPSAVLVVSAHWTQAPATLGAVKRVPLIYDFRGFPPALSQVQYQYAGAPALATRVQGLLGGAGIKVGNAASRGLDHGAWVPLRAMFASDHNSGDMPVLQLSLPSEDPKVLFAVGEALRPLRAEKVVILGSGQATHNLRRMDFSPAAKTPSWAQDFDQFLAESLQSGAVDRLLDFKNKAPGWRLSHPTLEHFTPLLVALGAGASNPATFPIEGWSFGSMSTRCVQFG